MEPENSFPEENLSLGARRIELVLQQQYPEPEVEPEVAQQGGDYDLNSRKERQRDGNKSPYRHTKARAVAKRAKAARKKQRRVQK